MGRQSAFFSLHNILFLTHPCTSAISLYWWFPINPIRLCRLLEFIKPITTFIQASIKNSVTSMTLKLWRLECNSTAFGALACKFLSKRPVTEMDPGVLCEFIGRNIDDACVSAKCLMILENSLQITAVKYKHLDKKIHEESSGEVRHESWLGKTKNFIKSTTVEWIKSVI
jgi:hypothetical protein